MGFVGGRGRADQGDQWGYNLANAAEGPRLYRMARARTPGGGSRQAMLLRWGFSESGPAQASAQFAALRKVGCQGSAG